MVLIVVLVVLVVIVAVVGLGVGVALVRRVTSRIGAEVSGMAQGQSGAQTIAQHQGELGELTKLAGRLGVHIDLADALGTTVAGTGMQQPTRATMHVVGRSAPDAINMRAPCTIAYAIEAPGVPAFSGEQVFEVWTAQWPEPNDTLPCVFDAANPTHVDIDWSQVQSTGEKALGDAQTLANELNQQPPGGATPPPPPSQGA